MRIDLHPFAAGIEAGAKIVMTSHIVFTALDPLRPATLSPAILGDLLRGEMGFDGMIVSDSMNMHSMQRNYEPADAAIQGFNAGVDLMMLAEEHYDHDAERYLDKQRALIRAVIAAVEDGRIAAERVDDAVGRVLPPQSRNRLLDGAAIRGSGGGGRRGAAGGRIGGGAPGACRPAESARPPADQSERDAHVGECHRAQRL